ncbi:MAG: DDE-type integrase/transposase/recombinase, partial [Bdellovibrionota bacterium]
MKYAERQGQIRRKLRIIQCDKFGTNVSKKCRHYGVSRDTFYRWKKDFERLGDEGLVSSKPCPRNTKIRTPQSTEEKVVHVRKRYHLGALRISWYMKRYFDIKISSHGVQGVLKRHGLQRLPTMKQNSPGPHFTLYEKKVPGHHIQMDVKVLIFNENGQKTKRYQYTAIDDATRIRILRVYEKQTQASSISFAKEIQKDLPFRIKMIRTDNGHEFQSQFHWYLMDEGIQHAYIR